MINMELDTQLYTLNDIFHYSRPPVIGGERTDDLVPADF